MTGFDAPSCSTIYLDKPMRNHTLMQTIARANRVLPGKVNGLIVDYIGIFRNLQKALAIYGAAPGRRRRRHAGAGQERAGRAAARGAREDERLSAPGRASISTRCRAARGFEFIQLRDDAVEAMLVNDDTKKEFLALAGTGRPAVQGHPARSRRERVRPEPGRA